MSPLATILRTFVISFVLVALSPELAFSDDPTEEFVNKNFNKSREYALEALGENPDDEDVLGIYGWAEFMLDNYIAAENAFKKLEEVDPGQFDAALGQAWTAIKLGRYDGAEPFLDEAEDRADDTQEPMVVDARAWLEAKRGNPDKARELFLAEEKIDIWGGPRGNVKLPKEDDPMVGLGWLELNAGNLEEAEKYFKKGLYRKKDCFFCRDGLARIALQEKKLEKALKHAVAGARATNHNNGLVALVDTVLVQINDAETSEETYTKLAKRHDEDALYQNKLGFLYLAQNKTSDANEAFKKSQELEPGNVLATIGMGRLDVAKTAFVREGWSLYYQGRYREAIEAFDAKADEAKSDDNPAALDGRGWTLLAQNKPNEALSTFNAALKISPTFANSRAGVTATQRVLMVDYSRGWALVNAGNFEAAAEAFNLARQQAPEDLMWLVEDGFAWIDFYKGDLETAKEQFTSIVSKTQDAYLSYKGLGFIALRNSDFDTAVKQLGTSFSSNAFQPLMDYTSAASTLLEAGQHDNAKLILELAEKIYPLSADVQFMLAKAYDGLKDKPTAATKLAIATRLAPAYIHPVFDQIADLPQDELKQARIEMGWGLYYVGNTEAALARFDEFFSMGSDNPDANLSARLGRAWTNLAANSLEQAAADFEQAGSIRENAATYTGLGWVSLNSNDVDGARQQFTKALEVIPGYAPALNGLYTIPYRLTAIVQDGWNAYYTARYNTALKAFEEKRLDAEAEKNPAAEDGRGWTLLAMGQPTEAAAAFEAALEIDSTFPFSRSGLIAAQRASMTRYNQAWAALNVGNMEAAEKGFEEARAETFDEFMWLIDDGLAWTAYYQEEYGKAALAFSAVIEDHPEAYISRKGLGYVALQTGDIDMAMQEVMASVGQNPFQAIGVYTFPATRLIEKREFNRAKDLLEVGERTYPASSDLKFLLAKVFKGLNDDTRAIEKAQQAVRLAPAYIHPVFDELELPMQETQQALLDMAWGLYYAGNSQAAQVRLDQYANAGGASLSASLAKGWIQLGLKDPEEAERTFKAILDEGTVTDGYAGLGWALLNQQRTKEAQKAFDRALELAPYHGSALSGVGSIQFAKTQAVKEAWEHYYKGEYEEALAAFDAKRDAVKSEDNPAAEDGRGWSLLALQRPQDAVQAFKAALEIDDAFPYSKSGLVAAERASAQLYNQAWAFLNAGQFEQAEKRFNEAREELPKNVAWLIDDGLAWSAFYQDKIDVAEASFKKIVDAEPNAYLSRTGLGLVAIEKRSYDEAMKHLKASFEQAPLQAISSYTVASLKLLENEQAQQAKEILELGERIYPYSVDVQFLLAKAFKALGNEDAALTKAQAAANLAPAYVDPVFDELELAAGNSKGIYYSLAWGQYFSGNNEAAIKRFDQYITLDGEEINAQRGRGFALFRLGQYDDAIEALEKVTAKEPDELQPISEVLPIPGTDTSWTVIYNATTTLAWSYYRTERPERAQKEFEKMLAVYPNWIDALTGLGYARLEQKNKQGAEEAFKEALKLLPYYPDALQGLGMVEGEKG